MKELEKLINFLEEEEKNSIETIKVEDLEDLEFYFNDLGYHDMMTTLKNNVFDFVNANLDSHTILKLINDVVSYNLKNYLNIHEYLDNKSNVLNIYFYKVEGIVSCLNEVGGYINFLLALSDLNNNEM